jgi:hypothetical protein
MATSGVYGYTLDTNDLILAAMRGLEVFNDDNPAPPPTDTANFQQALNLMLRFWIAKGVPLNLIQEIAVPLVSGVTSYQLGPGGAFSTWRPITIPLGRLTYTNQTPVLDIPLIMISRQEYTILGQKGSSGPPNSYFYDPQLTDGVLYLYLTPDSVTATNAVATMTCQRPPQAQINLTDNFDFPDEWILPIKICLMADMMEEYGSGIDAKKAQRIITRATTIKDEIFNSSVEQASTFMTPDARQSYHFRGRG